MVRRRARSTTTSGRCWSTCRSRRLSRTFEEGGGDVAEEGGRVLRPPERSEPGDRGARGRPDPRSPVVERGGSAGTLRIQGRDLHPQDPPGSNGPILDGPRLHGFQVDGPGRGGPGTGGNLQPNAPRRRLQP